MILKYMIIYVLHMKIGITIQLFYNITDLNNIKFLFVIWKQVQIKRKNIAEH